MSNTTPGKNPHPDPYGWWPPQVTLAEYNDDLAIKAYLKHFQTYRWFPYHWLKTDFEERYLELGDEYRKSQGMKENCQKTGNYDAKTEAIVESVKAKWYSDANADLRAELGDVCDSDEMKVKLNAFREKVCKRIDQLMQISGSIPVNRCPACNRVVRTPVAKQCMWCKHDWH